MSVIARFEIIPVRDGSMSTAIANALRALDRFPVSYRTTATDTTIEADTVEQIFEAVQAAHNAIPDDRVITSLEIDEDRRRPQHMRDRVASVEQKLGHPALRNQRQATGQSTSQPMTQAGQSMARTSQSLAQRSQPMAQTDQSTTTQSVGSRGPPQSAPR